MQNYSEIPIKVVQYLTHQLELEPVLIVSPPDRKATEYHYRQIIQEQLGLRDFDNDIEQTLQSWIEQHIQKDFPTQEWLVEQAEKYLSAQKIVLPAKNYLGRKIAYFRIEAQKSLYEKIAQRIPDKMIEKLDELILPLKSPILIRLQDLKRSPPAPSVKVMHDYLDRIEMIQSLHLTDIDLADIHPHFIEYVYRLANTCDIWELRRMAPAAKRYTFIVCFLLESYKTLLDHIIELNDKMLVEKERDSRHQFNEKSKKSRRQARVSEKIMIEALESLYQHPQPNTVTLAEFIASLNKEKIEQAIHDCKEFHWYEEEGILQELDLRYNHLRKYTPRFFQLEFKASTGSEVLIQSIAILKQLNDGTIKSLPKETPCSFVPASWKNALFNTDGSLRQRTWELALYYAVKEALAATNLYLPYSRHYRNFWETVYTESVWQEEKPNAYAQLNLPNQFDTILEKLTIEFKQNMQLAKNNLNKDSFAYLSKEGELKLRRNDALEIPVSTRKLRQQIEARMPVIRIEQLLKEVDQVTQFSNQFVPLKGFYSKSDIPAFHVHAAILAHATNMGLYGMAHSVEEITLDELRNASRWLIHSDSLKAGNTHLVNAHFKNPFSQIYGDGRRSSSDAQRYGIRASSLLASYYPRFFGYYDQAISIYTHTSALYSVFNTLVISCGVREATYVLTGLLSHDSLLNPEFHCTDTHGFTYHVFALCYLLGFSFQPRLKDLASQQLFKIDKHMCCGELDTLFSDTIDVDLIREQWDNLVKVSASLKNRLAPAHVIIGKLARRVSTDRTAKALIELGKLVKTIFILRYISDLEFRHCIQLQLNRGEHRHYLAQHIFFADQGLFKTNDYEDIMNKSSCLSFVSNAILFWNTLKIEEIVNQLTREGYPVSSEDLARISPLMFKHIIVHGIYQFTIS